MCVCVREREWVRMCVYMNSLPDLKKWGVKLWTREHVHIYVDQILHLLMKVEVQIGFSKNIWSLGYKTLLGISSHERSRGSGVGNWAEETVKWSHQSEKSWPIWQRPPGRALPSKLSSSGQNGSIFIPLPCLVPGHGMLPKGHDRGWRGSKKLRQNLKELTVKAVCGPYFLQMRASPPFFLGRPSSRCVGLR